MQNWFVQYIAVRDLQTRQRYYFLANRWFSLVDDDGQVIAPWTSESVAKWLMLLCLRRPKLELRYRSRQQQHNWRLPSYPKDI